MESIIKYLFFKHLCLVIAIAALPYFAHSQAPDLSKGNFVIYQEPTDSIKDRDKATNTLRLLKNGSVVVRLKYNQRSIEAYRKAGMPQVADRIAKENEQRNIKLMEAFNSRFTFCPTYFIKATDTKRLLSGEKVFLNSKLEYDSTIVQKDTFFIFCEYGVIEGDGKYAGNSALAGYTRPERILDTVASQSSTATYIHSAIHFLDKNLNQLRRPFPFGEQVMLDNYNMAVSFINGEINRAYNKLVINRDIQDEFKKERKRQKQLRKSLTK